MLIASEPKFETLREIVDEEVTRRSMASNISRMEAYVSLANELGYSIRAYTGNEGWACIIAMPGLEWLQDIASRFVSRRQERLRPIQESLTAMHRQLDVDIDSLRQAMADKTIDLACAEKKLAELQAQMVARDAILQNLEEEDARLQHEFAEEFCQELTKQIVVFGVSVEVALIACVLRMLDPQCEVFLSVREIKSLYTTQDLRRRAGAMRNRRLAPATEVDSIPVLDEQGACSDQGILARGVARMIDAFVTKIQVN